MTKSCGHDFISPSYAPVTHASELLRTPLRFVSILVFRLSCHHNRDVSCHHRRRITAHHRRRVSSHQCRRLSCSQGRFCKSIVFLTWDYCDGTHWSNYRRRPTSEVVAKSRRKKLRSEEVSTLRRSSRLATAGTRAETNDVSRSKRKPSSRPKPMSESDGDSHDDFDSEEVQTMAGNSPTPKHISIAVLFFCRL